MGTKCNQKKYCPICLGALNPIIGLIRPCKHQFCFSCILKWSGTSNVCPLDRTPFRKIVKLKQMGKSKQFEEVVAIADTQINEESFLETIAEEFDAYIAAIVCENCDSGVDEDILLLCDICNLGYHTYCLQNPLHEVPTGEWYCDECNEILFKSNRFSHDKKKVTMSIE